MATKTYITPKFRCSFMNVFKAVPNMSNTANEYNVTALIPKDADLSGLKQAWDDVAKEEWGKIPPRLRPLYSRHKDDKGMLGDGDRKYAEADAEKQESYDAYRGCYTANLKSAETKPPKVVDANKDEIINVADFKSGDYARAVLELSSYDHKQWGPQVSVKLLVIQKLADGPAFGGGVSTAAALDMLDPAEVDPNQDLF